MCAALFASCGEDEHLNAGHGRNGSSQAAGQAGQPSGEAGSAQAGVNGVATTGGSGGEAGEAFVAQAAGAAGATPASDCVAAGDCVYTRYYQEVSMPADCYCPACPGTEGAARLPVNASTDARRRAAWTDLCGEWSLTNPCLPWPCPVELAPICDGAGQCQPAP